MDTAQSTSPNPAIIAYAARAGRRHCIKDLMWSYDAEFPVGFTGRLTIENGAGNICFDLDVTGHGAGLAPVVRESTPGVALIITLYAGGGALVGKVNVCNYWHEDGH